MKIIAITVALFAFSLACNKRKDEKTGDKTVPAQLGLPQDENSIPTPRDSEEKPQGEDKGPEVPSENLPLEPTISTSTFDCDTLESGIYWFGKGDVAQKARATTRSSHFDPAKPTMIHVHGWQSGSHRLKRRATFNYGKTDPIEGVKVDAADAWIDAGWNIGIFYWNQISDESEPIEAENKVWGTSALTWKDCKGKAIPVGDGSIDAVDAFYKAYMVAMKGYTGNNVRLGGHSLGNQMVTRLASRLQSESSKDLIDARLVPKRVALLDPWWSAPTLTQTRSSDLRKIIQELKGKGMIFEWYKTSDVTSHSKSDDNSELIADIGQTEILPDYYSSLNQGSRHMSAQFLYYLTFKDPPPPACVKPCTDLAPSAATSDERVKEVMMGALRYRQVLGNKTPVTSDNAFMKISN